MDQAYKERLRFIDHLIYKENERLEAEKALLPPPTDKKKKK